MAMNGSTGLQGRTRGLLSQAVPLAAILLLAVELRLLFHTGLVHLDGWQYAESAYRLAHGSSVAGTSLDRWGVVRIGLYGPVTVLYALFGVRDLTTLAWPFVCSLLAVCGAYAVARVLAGEAAGLLAAIMWAVLPTDIAAGTTLLGDAPIAALSMWMVFFLLVATALRGRRRAGAYAAAFACLALAAVTKLLVMLVMPFLVIYFVFWGPRSRTLWLVLAGTVVAGFGLYYFATHTAYMHLDREWHGWPAVIATLAETSTRWWSRVVIGHQDYSWISPLWVVAIAALLALRRREGYIPLIWLGTTFLYLEAGTRSPFTYEPLYFDPITSARHFLFVAAPAVIATGVYLSIAMRAAVARRLAVLVVAIVGTAAWVGTRHATNLAWGVTGETSAELPFATVSALATAVVIFGGIGSPAFATGRVAPWKTIPMAALILAIGFASLNPSYRAASEFRLPSVKTFPEAARYLDKAPRLPILVQNQVFGQQLDYASGFQFGQAGAAPGELRARVRVAPEDPNAVGDAYVLVDDLYSSTGRWGPGPAYLKDPPPSWAEVARFGTIKGYQLRLYRASTTMATNELAIAKRAVDGAENPETLRRLVSAATNAAQYCLAARSWAKLRGLAPDSVRDFDPLKILRACYDSDPGVAGPNLIVNADFHKGLDGWSHPAAAGATLQIVPDTVDAAEQVLAVNARSVDQRVITLQGAVLRPSTPYVFEGTFKTTAPIVALYWESDVGRFDSEAAFPEWTTRRYVFVTPAWDGKPRHADIHPFLLTAPGQVFVKKIKLAELRFD